MPEGVPEPKTDEREPESASTAQAVRQLSSLTVNTARPGRNTASETNGGLDNTECPGDLASVALTRTLTPGGKKKVQPEYFYI